VRYERAIILVKNVCLRLVRDVGGKLVEAMRALQVSAELPILAEDAADPSLAEGLLPLFGHRRFCQKATIDAWSELIGLEAKDCDFLPPPPAAASCWCVPTEVCRPIPASAQNSADATQPPAKPASKHRPSAIFGSPFLAADQIISILIL
jgi:hypothetical protein